MNQPQHMAMAGMGGPVGGGPIGQQINAGTPNSSSGTYTSENLINKLNTAIYDYLLCNAKYDAARAVFKSMSIETDTKHSPSQPASQTNGADDSMDIDGKDHKNMRDRPSDLPAPHRLSSDNTPFLQDWWCQFWELYQGNRQKGKPTTLSYVGNQRQAQKQRQGMMGGNMDPSAMRSMPGYNAGMMNANMDLKKRVALQNLSPAQMQQMQQMRNMANQNQANQGNQMERQGSQMDGPHSGSPNTGDAPSPKRPRIDGNMQQLNQGRPGQPGPMPGNQVGPPSNIPPPTSQIPLDALSDETHRLLLAKGLSREDVAQMSLDQLQKLEGQPTNVRAKSIEIYSQGIQAQMLMQRNNSNTNKGPMPQNPNIGGPGGAAGAQSSPMNQAGVDGNDIYGANRMPGMPQNGSAVAAGQPGGVSAAAAAAAAQNNGNHALQDYQMQLMLLEQQNKKRLLMARQEQDSMSHAPGVPGTNPGMMDPGVPPQMRGQMMMNGPNGQMMRPPSSHPMQNQMTPQQIEMMRGQQGQMMPNGGNWPQGAGPQPPQGQMIPGQQQPGQGGPPGQQPNMTPRPNNMPPPPAPQANNAGGTQPSSPAQPPAPPTPNQQNKPKPGSNKKTESKSAKVSAPSGEAIAMGYPNQAQAAANKKGAVAANDAADAPTQTPPPPATPNNAANFQQNKNANMTNGQSNQAQQQNNAPNGQPPANAVQPQQPDMGVGPPFGDLGGADQFAMDYANPDSDNLLDNFDFDMFLNAADEGNFQMEPFPFGDSSLEAGGDASGI